MCIRDRPFTTPPRPTEAFAAPGTHQMPPYLLLYPAFDHSETNTRMANPKVVHPPAQNRIDFRNHGLDGPADVLSEDLPEPFKQRYPRLQLGCIVGSPLPLKAQYTPIFKTQESEALSLLQIHHPTLVLVDLHAELRKLLAQPSVYRLHQPVTPPFSVDQDRSPGRPQNVHTGRWLTCPFAWYPPLSPASGLPHSDRGCLLYTSDAADEEDSVDLGGRRIIKKKKTTKKSKITKK